MLWKVDPTYTSLLEVMNSKTNNINLQDNIKTVMPWTTYCLPVQYCTKISKVISISCQRLLSTNTCIARWRLGRVSRGFHFWQPAPRLNITHMASPTVQPSHQSPQKKDTKQNRHPSHWENISKEQLGGEGRGGERKKKWKKETSWQEKMQHKRKTPHATESHERCSKLLGMHMLITTDHYFLAKSYKCLHYTCVSFLDLSKAQRSFAQVLNDLRFEYIGEVETDDEMLIGEYLTTAFLQAKTQASLLNSQVEFMEIWILLLSASNLPQPSGSTPQI